jgi:hypothetical protein
MLVPTVAWYLGASGVTNLLWETAQLPFYSIWRTGSAGAKAFALLHCTAGDVMIAGATLVVAVLLVGARRWPGERYLPVAAVAIAAGLLYTVFSEWLNVYVRRSWAYDAAMPTLLVGGIPIGLAPLAQWLVVPAIAFAVAWRATLRNTGR